jgi:hypothetical protein
MHQKTTKHKHTLQILYSVTFVVLSFINFYIFSVLSVSLLPRPDDKKRNEMLQKKLTQQKGTKWIWYETISFLLCVC